MTDADALAALIRERRPCVVLTGAGISTESGIPDFRSAAGIWATVDPAEVATIDAFERDPERVWRWYGPRIASLLEAEPNAGHLALAELERRGLVQAVITQNIDTLHTRAGSSEVVEVHGSIRRAGLPALRDAGAARRAARSARPARHAAVRARAARSRSPTSSSSASCSLLEPMARAERLAGEAGLLLVVGTTLEVWPVAACPSGRRPRAARSRSSTAGRPPSTRAPI